MRGFSRATARRSAGSSRAKTGMLPKDYPGENCWLARPLEVIGERWTLRIIRERLR
jgi:DNA-binding HxlR family transcriptional regulator